MFLLIYRPILVLVAIAGALVNVGYIIRCVSKQDHDNVNAVQASLGAFITDNNAAVLRTNTNRAADASGDVKDERNGLLRASTSKNVAASSSRMYKQNDAEEINTRVGAPPATHEKYKIMVDISAYSNKYKSMEPEDEGEEGGGTIPMDEVITGADRSEGNFGSMDEQINNDDDDDEAPYSNSRSIEGRSATTGSSNEGKVTSINLIGERHSGVDWIAEHLNQCFGNQITVETSFTRFMHWFQIDDEERKNDSSIVIAMFRDPYDWVEEMRESPQHAHHHIGMDWREFVTTPWTGQRGRGDRTLLREAGGDEADIEEECLGGYEFPEVVPCSEEDSLFEDGYGNYMYEMKHGEPNQPYQSITELRTAKIANFLEVPSYHGIKSFFPERYEELKRGGTANLLKKLEKVAGLTASCKPLDGTGVVNKRLNPEFVEWMNKNHDWSAESLIGYVKRNPVALEGVQHEKQLETLSKQKSTGSGNTITLDSDHHHILQNRTDLDKHNSKHSTSPCLNKDFWPMNSKSVWSMLIADDDEEGVAEGYLNSAVKLGHSVLSHVHEVPIDLVMMELRSKPLSSDVWKALHSAGWQQCTVERIAPLDEEGTKTRFRDQFTKFHLWGMTMYDTILYLDSDTLVVQSIDALLQTDLRARRKRIGVTRDYRDFLGGWLPTFNLGVFLIHPSDEEYQRLLKLQQDPSVHYITLMAEQSFLNEIYWNHWYDIGFEHNGNICVFSDDREYWDAHEEDIKIVHYTCEKPWECSSKHDVPCGWWNSFE